MKQNKVLGILLWLVGIVLAHLIVFLLPQEMEKAEWITYGFTLIAFFSQLILWFAAWREKPSPEQQFLQTPLLFYSVCYIAGQIILCVIFALVSTSGKIAVIVNAIFLASMCLLFVFSLIGRNHVDRIDQRQKNHHTKL